jgi:hypothetical protein
MVETRNGTIIARGGTSRAETHPVGRSSWSCGVRHGQASSGARPGRHWREHLTGTAVLVGAGQAFRLVERPAGTAPPPPASAVAPAARPQPEQRPAAVESDRGGRRLAWAGAFPTNVIQSTSAGMEWTSHLFRFFF